MFYFSVRGKTQTFTMAKFTVLTSLSIFIVTSCLKNVCSWSCPKQCNCSRLTFSTSLLDVKCDSPYVPNNIPTETASLTLYGLNGLGRQRLNHTLVNLENLTIADAANVFYELGGLAFCGLQSVRRLILSNIGWLSSIDPSAFQQLTNLTSITFDRIPMRIARISESLIRANNKTLREVNIRCDGLKMMYAEILDDQIYRSYMFLHITHFSVTSCSLAVTRPGFSKYLPHLQFVNISYNFLGGDKLSVIDLLLLPDIAVLDMSYQNYNKMLESGPKREQNMLTTESERNIYHSCNPIRVPPKLTHLYCHHTLGYLNWIPLCIHRKNKLLYIDVSDDILFRLSTPFIGFLTLEYLNVQNLQLVDFPLNIFGNVPMLKVVLLGYNKINKVIENDVRGMIFQNNTHLSSLHMAYCDIKSLPDAFMCSVRTIEYLHLEGNHLQNIDLTCLQRLKFLNISNNRFSRFPERFFESLDRMGQNVNITVDLTNNPISSHMGCCDISDWLNSYQVGNIKFYGSKEYTCVLDSTVREFKSLSAEKLHRKCSSSAMTFGVSILIFLAAVLFVGISMFVVIYRKRWCLKTYILASKRYLKSHQERNMSDKYIFDAFVAYNETDSLWVREVLIRHLERVHRLKLCIHERNFMPGEPIEENISNAIEMSRRVILVISEAFFTSYWCIMEMRLARQMALQRGRDILIPIILQKVDTSKGNKTLFNILNENTYLEWPHDEIDGQTLFLQRLAEAMKSNIEVTDV